jgi:hypothetical protein
MWDVFTYTVTISVQTAASTSTATSLAAIVTLVPPSGAIFGSDFLTSNDGWTVVGNRWEATAAVYDSSSRGIVNQYVYGFDDIIDVSWSGAIDKCVVCCLSVKASVSSSHMRTLLTHLLRPQGALVLLGTELVRVSSWHFVRWDA